MLNQLPVVIVGVELPFIIRLGLLVMEPPVVPNTKVRVLTMSDLNPASPTLIAGSYAAVHVKLVTVAILNTVVPGVVCVRLINAGAAPAV